MKDDKKLTFWKRLKYSIIDFDKYQELATEKIWRTIVYVAILIFVFTLVVTGMYTYKFTTAIASVRDYIDENIETITFENNELSVIPKNHEKTTMVENENIGIKVIVNTDVKDASEINSGENSILILKDKLVINNELMTNAYTCSYQTISEQYNINKINKQEVLNLLSFDTIKPLIFWVFAILLIYFFIIIYLPTTLIDVLVLSLFGYMVTLITRIKLRYSAIYNIAAYSLTLSIILNILYFVVNSLTGFTIQYFEVMYTAVATIYIAAAIMMIRSDIIKRQIELTQIIKEQDRIREEMQRREEEEKQQEEKEETKKDDKEKQKKKDKEDGMGKEPEGNNV